MAKDVDLSSKEWRDLVFEGKNKEYGAYTLRAASQKRHNRAMIAVIIILAVVAALAFLVNTVMEKIAEQRPTDEIEQEMAMLGDAEAPEDEPEEEQQRVEEQKPEALPEEILNTVKSSEIKITADEEVTEEIKSQDDLKNDDRAIGQTNFDQGTDDLNVVREHKEEVIVEEKKPEPVKEEVFTAVEQMPTFPGGDAALMQYLSSHIKYPAAAAENGIQGRVTVQFVVTKTGAIGEVKVVRSKDPDLDKEAVRVVKSLPKFNPGRMNGQAVAVWYTLPVNFKLATN
ncbi:MAG: energy transducer TonB [Muribaculaceae bacterium]|nr:energy transducer TonB [Muribaculaceae bacterium]